MPRAGFRVVCAAAARGSRSVLRCVAPSGSPSLIAVEQSRPLLRCRVVHGDLGRRSPCAARGELRLDLLHGDHPQHDAAVNASQYLAVCSHRPAIFERSWRCWASERRGSEGGKARLGGRAPGQRGWESEAGRASVGPARVGKRGWAGERRAPSEVGTRERGASADREGWDSESWGERGSRGVGIARVDRARWRRPLTARRPARPRQLLHGGGVRQAPRLGVS